MRTLRCSLAERRSASVSSAALTGLTSAQCSPTGQRWSRHHPSRIAFSDASGTQIGREDVALVAADNHVAAERVPASAQHDGGDRREADKDCRPLGGGESIRLRGGRHQRAPHRTDSRSRRPHLAPGGERWADAAPAHIRSRRDRSRPGAAGVSFRARQPSCAGPPTSWLARSQRRRPRAASGCRPARLPTRSQRVLLPAA
jgi:hypothetical protein